MNNIKTKFIKEITIIDPDSLLIVDIGIYKLETGGIVGIDSSFLETDMDVYSPFDKDYILNLD